MYEISHKRKEIITQNPNIGKGVFHLTINSRLDYIAWYTVFLEMNVNDEEITKNICVVFSKRPPTISNKLSAYIHMTGGLKIEILTATVLKLI